MRITRFQQLLSLLLAIGALLVLANAWLAFHAEEVLATSEFWVTHTLEVITNLERVLHTAADAESSVRGYIISSDDRYLIPYRQAAADLPAQFDLLAHQTRDNPGQMQRLQQAKRIASSRLTLLSQSIDAQRANGIRGQASLMEKQDAQQLMNQLHSSVGGIDQEERRLLAERLQVSAHARTEAKLTVALASALDILFLVFAFGSLTYERRLRQRAAESSERLEKLQSVTDVAFTQLTAEELTQELLHRLRQTTEIDALVLCRWTGDSLEVAAGDGLPIQRGERRSISADGPIAEAVRTGKNVRLVGESVGHLPIEVLQEHAASVLIVPMMVASRVIAILVATRRSSASFNAPEEELLSLAADRIALALDRAAAYDAERAARHAAEASAARILELNEALEERVAQRTAELEATNRELEAFSYSVSHDLRAPLRSVDGFSVALEEDYGALLTGDGQHYLSRIRAGVQRMGQLIDALLQLSRITRAELSAEPTDLSALAEAVAAEINSSRSEPPVQFVIAPALHAEVDPRLMRAVFENMFGNAVKFTGKVPHPRVEFGYTDQQQAFYIRDNGAGFDQQYAGKLFVAFQRLHGEKDFAGSGIGLATVARVIHRHHGRIWAEGAVGAGATFWFTLG